MSKALIFFLFLVFAFKCESSEDIFINLVVENGEKRQEVKLTIDRKTYINSLDSLGVATIRIKGINKEKQSEVWIGDYIISVWLEPDKDFDIYVNLDKLNRGIEFYGEGALKNELWNGKYLNALSSTDYYLSEEDFKEKLEGRRNSYFHILDSLDIDKDFKNALLSKFKYKTFYDLSLYPGHFSSFLKDSLYFPTYGFYTYFLSYFPKETKEAYLYNYNDAFYKWVEGLKFVSNNSDPYHKMQQRLEYIEKNISYQGVQDFLTDCFTVNYINQYGIDSIDVIKTNYNSKVSDRQLRLQFETFLKDWEKLEKGKNAPDFKIQISDTSDLNLKDFAGKYLYIYVWEPNQLDSLSHLKTFNTLVNRFKNQNINFVNLFIGNDRKIWEQFLEQNSIEGLTLYIDYSNSLLENYKIYHFPIAILIDREGKIINPRMTLPGNPETIEFFRRLF